MGKGGAPTTTQTVQNQNVAYTPTGLQGFQDIYNKAASVASQPYQPYTGQLVQGLTPTQTGAIGQISNIAANPLSAAQIQQYENPYQQDVINATMGNINETNRQQMAQTTGQLTQAAGGIGAERIALGQGELARQQALASNQTLAGLNQQNYAQALQTAQQQQGFGLGAAQARLGAGALEQQTGQAGLTAAYQQYLQQLAFPYQQAQFLAGVGIPALGAMGGQQYQTGTANQTMTPPGLSWLQGLAGVGALGYGAYQGYNQPQQQASARGGRIYADGGGIDDDDHEQHTIDLQPHEYRDEPSNAEEQALAPVLSDQGYVPTGKEIQTPQNQIKPMAPMQTQQSGGGGGGNSTMSGLAGLGKLIGTVAGAFFKSGGYVSGYDDGGTVPSMGGMGAPGANAYPTPASLGSPLARGPLPQSPQMNSPNVFYGRPLPNMLPPSPVTGQQAGQNMYEMARQVLQQQQLGQALASIRGRTSQPEVSVSAQEYARGGYADGGDTDDSFSSRYPGAHDFDPTRPDLPDPDIMSGAASVPYTDAGSAPWQGAGQTAWPQEPIATKGDRLDRVTPYPSAEEMSAAKQRLAAGMTRPDSQLPPTSTPNTGVLPQPYPTTQAPGAGFDPATARPSDILNLDNYSKQVANRPTVRGLMSNPDFWMRTGLNILAANPAHGALSAIASGAGATVGEYDKWSKDDLTSKQKAQELAGKLMEHAQKYTRMTPAERERLDIEHEKLQQGHYQAVNYTDAQGRLNVGRFNTKTGQIVDSEGNPVNASRIYGRSSQIKSDEITPQQMSLIIDRFRKNHPTAVGLSDDEVRELALKEINAAKTGAAAPPPRPPGLSESEIIGQARTAVQADPSKRDAVLQRLKAWGIDTSGM